MVRLIAFLVLTLLAANGFGAQSLQLITDKNTIELGKGLPARIIATNLDSSLTRINIDALKLDFGLEIIESANHERGSDKIQELSLLIYPRHTGLLALPALSLGNFSSREQTVTVSDARNTAGEIQFTSTIHPDAVWQRQQIQLTVSIITASRFSTLQVDEFNQPGFDIIQRPVSRERLTDGKYKLTTGWHIYPLLDGLQRLYPPAINLRLSGKIQQKFFPPAQQLKIMPLPSYIPPLMPVGKLAITSTITDDYQWRLNVISNTVSSASLSNLPLSLPSVKSIHYGEMVTPKLTAKPLADIFTYLIPLSFDYSGVYRLPALTIKTFDPETGRIVTQHTEPELIIYLNKGLKIALVVLAFVIAGFLAKKLITFAVSKRRALLQRKEIVRSTLSAKSPHALHHLLNAYANNRNWGSNLTLSQWQRIWDKHKKTSPDQLIEQLSLACYAKPMTNITQEKLNKNAYELLSK